MHRKKLYSLLAILIIIVIYTYDHYLSESEQTQIIENGKISKPETNPYFLPSSTTGQIIHHDYYSLSYSEVHEQAEWVAYELKASHLSSSNHKRPYFEIDHAVTTKAAHWRNYKNSGYDRGHLCPAGDRRFSKTAHDETFLTSNISPQEHEFNSGIWNRLEQKTRYWARKYDGLYIVTGGILKDGLEYIGEEQISIPEYFYKVLIDYDNGQPKMLAFLIPHEDSDKPLYNFVVSVDDIERLTGIDFFPKLEDTIETNLEASNSYKHWSF